MGTEIAPTAGVQALPRTLRSYQTTLRGRGAEAFQRIPELLGADEPLRALAVADLDRIPVVLALTDKRVLVLDERSPAQHLDLDLGGWLMTPKRTMWSGTSLTLAKGGREIVFRRFGPVSESDRIFFALAGEQIPDRYFEALPDDWPRDPGHPPIAGLWEISVYPDRIVDHELRHLPFNGEVNAMAEVAGDIAAVRGRNLADKGLGTLFFGPVGLFLMGNAKTQTIDKRELYLLVEGPTWAYTQQFKPDVGAELRAFAQEINVAAKQCFNGSVGQDPTHQRSGETTLPEQIRELLELKNDGALSQDEFETAKQKLLERQV